MTPLSLILTPYRLISMAAAVLLTLTAVYALGRSHGADAVQARWDAAVVRQSLTAARAEAESRAKEQSMQRKLNEAQNAATEREKALRADYAAAHAAARGLRNTVAALRSQLSDAPAEACRATADAALAVFSECTDRYGAVAEAAGGHASDVRTLSDAWPE